MIFAKALGMKKNILFSIFISMIAIASFGQDNTQKNVKSALQVGSSREIAPYLAASVEVKTDKVESTMNKNQAMVVLKDFFRAHSPKSFEYNHLGESPSGSLYGIGTYQAYDGSFRVYLKYTKVGTTFYLDTIEFTKEN